MQPLSRDVHVYPWRDTMLTVLVPVRKEASEAPGKSDGRGGRRARGPARGEWEVVVWILSF